MKFWSRTQHNITLSSAEAELVALVKGGCEGLGMISLMRDFGDDSRSSFDIFTDAAAAIAITQRKGVGRTRHIDVGMLWVQQRQRQGDLSVQKINGKLNPADILTKAVPAEIMHKHLKTMGFEARDGRAKSAVQLVGD